MLATEIQTLPPSRAQLVGEIEALESRAQAEADFSVVAMSDEANPWEGAGAALVIAREQLAHLAEQERLASFKSVVALYRERYRRLQEARAKMPRVREIEAEQSALYLENRELHGNPHFPGPIDLLARFRTGKPLSPLDAREREIAKSWTALEDERARLETAIEQAKAQCTHIEQQNPYLAALGEQPDGEQR